MILRDVVTSFNQLDYGAALAAVLVAVLGREFLELLLVLVLLADVVLGALSEDVLAADTGQLTTYIVLADGVCDVGWLAGHVCRWMQELCASWVAAVHAESGGSQYWSQR